MSAERQHRPGWPLYRESVLVRGGSWLAACCSRKQYEVRWLEGLAHLLQYASLAELDESCCGSIDFLYRHAIRSSSSSLESGALRLAAACLG